MTPPPEQRRLLTTTVPGPRSAELMAPEEEAVATGVGTTKPVLAAAAGGGAVVDVDGNFPIDLGTSGDVLRVPPVTIGDGLLAQALDTLAAGLAESRRRPVARTLDQETTS